MTLDTHVSFNTWRPRVSYLAFVILMASSPLKIRGRLGLITGNMSSTHYAVKIIFIFIAENKARCLQSSICIIILFAC